ncbi:MAG: glycoside hydrolase family 3 C-terminal domain-containing protein [Actinomycetota bacterium]|nr:glycoside hydrolase family 3 C-terminal domain-containing protein [Actinomycetota bacterium]
MTSAPVSRSAVWRDPSVDVATRVAALLGEMTVEEKVAQLYGVWVGADTSGAGVAPHQHEMAGIPVAWEELIRPGLGQLTRPFGTAPVDPEMGARGVATTQREIVGSSRLGIPAMVHEECLTGLAAWQATVYPAPLSWGASFDPALVERMGAAIGATMRSLGVHQGLAPVLDVTRDLRWGRVEETIGEDPYLVGTIGSAYVRGVESAGVVATLKHFVGYSSSRAGRNLAPVSIGPRELADVLLPPFEMAVRAGVRSVMNSYSDIDGVPVAADATLLTDLLRSTFGFAGTVVADYFSVTFLETLHGVAGDKADAAQQALEAGIDIELPTVACFGQPLLKAIGSGEVELVLVDRAVERVLRQKCELGLLDEDWDPTPPALQGEGRVELDTEQSRSIARELAERAVVLLANDGTLPLAPGRKVAVIGPQADATHAMMGCYSFPLHVGAQHPDVPVGVRVDTLLDAFRALGDHDVSHVQGCPVLGGSDDDIAAAAEVARDADVCVLALGDLAGLFGRGTSGEGCDVADLRLPGRQEELLEAVLATGTPVIAVLMVGRPYDLSRQVHRLAAVVCGFFLGEEGGPVLAEVLTGRLEPAGRLPVSFPGPGGSQPATYLAAPLASSTEVSSIDPTSLFAFGHGLSYGETTWSGVTGTSGEWPTNGECEVSVTVRNAGDRVTSDVVQVYLHDAVAQVARPVQQLIAAQRVDLPVGGERTVTFRLHADLTSYTGRAGQRIVDPGAVELRIGASSVDIRGTVPLTLTGARRVVGHDRVMHATVELSA